MEYINEFLIWQKIKRLSDNRVVRSSYFWVIITPILAKHAHQIERVLTYYAHTPITLQLPFSWKMFYFGATSFAISSIIFSLRCPSIIRNFDNPIQYKDTGREKTEFDRYVRSLYCKDQAEDVLRKMEDEAFSAAENFIGSDGRSDVYQFSAQKNGIKFNVKFFFLCDLIKRRNPTSIASCFFFQSIGYSCFLFVLLQNFLSVFKQLF
jgi:hypothetical protein